jgi:Fe2+ or Zn2+ uptake regulation protein
MLTVCPAIFWRSKYCWKNENNARITSQPVSGISETTRKCLTRNRRLIAETVFLLAPPFDANAVIEAVRKLKTQHRVSRETVYRTLRELVQSGLVSTQSSSNTYSVSPPKAEALLSLCASTHSKLIAGTCPWCGRAIIQGKLHDNSD